MPRSGEKKTRLIAACAGSLALHALVIAGAARISFEAAEREQPPAVDIVWLAGLPMPDRPRPDVTIRPLDPDPEPDTDPEPDPDREPDTDPETPPEPDTASASPPEPDTASASPPELETSRPAEPDSPPEPPEPVSPQETDAAPPEPEPLPESASDAEDAPETTRPPPPDAPAPDLPRADDPSESFVVTEADLEDAWRRAREEVREQSERERDYLTFSLDDVTEEPPPEEPGAPAESIFEAAERYRGSGGPSVLSPNSARTRVGRALAEFCNALTGGFGIGFGGKTFASVCAEPGESAKLFAHIKPAYLRSRPVCTEVDTGTVMAEGEAPTIKCELVEQEEPGSR